MSRITKSHGESNRYLGTRKKSCKSNTFLLQSVLQIDFFSYLCSVLNDIRIMENLKLVSVRIDPKDLEDLDKIVEDSSYVKRSDLIQAGIRLYLAAHQQGKGREVRSFFPRWGDVVDKFEFEYHREHR